MDLMTYMLAQKGGGGGSDLPVVTPADNGKILGVVSGAWSTVNPDTVIDLPMTLQVGTQESPVYLSELDEGLYAINGKYYILRDSEPLETDYNIIALVSKEEGLDKTKVKVITADNVTDYDIKVNGSSIAVYTNKIVTEKYLRDNHYVVETDLAGYMPKISNPDVGRVTISNSNGNVQESDYTILDSDNRGISGVLTGYMFNDGEEPPVYPMTYWDSVNCTVHTTEFDKDHVVTGYSESWSDGPGHLVMTGEENLDLVSTGVSIDDVINGLLPTVTSSDNGKVLGVSNGTWNKINVDGMPLIQDPVGGMITKSTNEGTVIETGYRINDLATKSFIGSIPQSSSSATTIVDYIDEVTTPIQSIANTPTAIATFNASALPMPSLSVGIEPVQDLHGYDSPWVGGAGKNKLKDDLYFDRTLNGVTFARQADGGIKITGTATQNFRVNYSNAVALKTGQYILSGGATKVEVALQGFGYVTTDEKSITVESDVTYEAWLYLYGDTAYNTTIYPMLRPSNTDSTYAPYENKCPIIGHTEANVTRSGKNLVNIRDKTMASAGYVFAISGLKIKKGMYTFSAKATTSASMSFAVYGNGVAFINTGFNGTSISFETTDTITDIRLYTSGAGTFEEIMLERGSTATDYVPYNPDSTTTPIAFTVNGETKTIYSGYVEVINGKVKAVATDENIASYNGETLPSTWISDRDVYAEGTTPTIGAQVVYKLATPIEYDLADVSISTQDGTNNLWADSGDVLSGEYRSARYQDIYTYGALPSVVSSDNGKILQVVNGEWQAVDLDANSTSY